MKWVVISLLLLNAVFLVVQLNKEEQTEQAVEQFPFNGPKLVLLTEKERQDKAKQLAGKKRPVSAAKRAPKPVKKVVAVARPKTEAKPPKPAIVPAAKPVPTPIAKSQSAAMACYSVGPFLLISDVKGITPLFERSAISTQERSEALRKQVGYWVYIPPAVSQQLAEGVLSQLKKNDFGDALIIAEGAKANAISIGVYKTEARGKGKQKILAQQLGYEAKIEPLFRTQPQYWLDLELMQATQLPDKLWREVIAGYPAIKQVRRKCG